MPQATVDNCINALITHLTLQERMPLKGIDTLDGARVYGSYLENALETFIKCKQISCILVLKQFS